MISRDHTTTHRIRNIAGIALLMAILAGPAFSTTIARMDLAQLVHRSDFIMQGQVQSVYPQWDAEKRLIYTLVSIRVDDPLKGDQRGVILIRQLGGTIGDVQMSVAGVPQFKSGEQTIVFLKRQNDTTYEVVGMNQGLYEVVDGFAFSNVVGVDLFDVATGETTKPTVGGRAPLEQFKTKIRELIR